MFCGATRGTWNPCVVMAGQYLQRPDKTGWLLWFFSHHVTPSIICLIIVSFSEGRGDVWTDRTGSVQKRRRFKQDVNSPVLCMSPRSDPDLRLSLHVLL